MSRIPNLEPAEAAPEARVMLEEIQTSFGRLPNLYRTMAASPAVLDAFRKYSVTLRGGDLSNGLREQIALLTAETNRSAYGLSAHSTIAKTVAGLDDESIQKARRGEASDTKASAALRFATALMGSGGHVSDAEFASVKQAGVSDGEIIEVIANVAMHIFTNFLSTAAQIPVDFPLVEPQPVIA